MEKHTRRVRGNSEPPPDEDLPIVYWHADEPEQNDSDDVVDFLLAFTILIIIIVVLMFVWGKFQ